MTGQRESDYPARRLSGGITFYDLGMILVDGEYQDIDSQLIKDFSNMSGSGLPFPLPLTDADFAVRDALVLANLETAVQIKTEYTEVIAGYAEFDDDFVSINEPSSVWTNKGLKTTQQQLAADEIRFVFGFARRYFDHIVIKGEQANKITAEYDYAADAADYDLQKNDKIYLVPTYCRSFLDEMFSNYEGFFNFIQQLNYFWLFFPRTPLLNGITADEIDGKDLPNARVMRSTQTTFGGTFTNSAQSASAYVSDSTDSIFHQAPADSTREGFLVAIIKQGNQTFYVWKD